MRLSLFAVIALVLAAPASAEQRFRTGCFIGPTFIQGLPDDACLVPDDWPRAMEQPVVGSHGRPLVLLLRGWLSRAADKTVASRVRRCAEYFTTHRGPAIDTPEQSANYAVFRRACMTAEILFDAGAGPGALVQSFIARDGSDLLRLEAVPEAVLAVAWSERLELGGPRLGPVMKSGKLIVLDTRLGQQRVRWRDREFTLTPTGRADANDDGFEDLIVMVSSSPLSGGDRKSQFVLLTRKARNAKLETVGRQPLRCRRELSC